MTQKKAAKKAAKKTAAKKQTPQEKMAALAKSANETLLELDALAEGDEKLQEHIAHSRHYLEEASETISPPPPPGKLKGSLVGCDGNINAVFAKFQKEARRADWSQRTIDKVLKEAQSGDYNHALATIMEQYDGDSGDNDEGDD